MAKLLTLDNLRLVCSAGNLVRGSRDGVYLTNNGYVVTCCHGEQSGAICLQVNDSLVYTTPSKIRNDLRSKLGVNIDLNEKICLLPCNPARVRSRYSMQLKRENVVVGCNRWNGDTMLVIYKNGNKTFGNTEVTSHDFIKIVYGKSSDIKLALTNGTI